MLKWVINRKLKAFESEYDYSMDYARDMLALGPGVFMRFMKAAGIGDYCSGVPRAGWYAAKLSSVIAEDCGPCTQLLVTMAQREGICPELLTSVLLGRVEEMPRDVALCYRFARSVVARDDTADDLRRLVVAEFGRAGLVSLAYAVLAGRIYPTVKFALGHAQACRSVQVNGASVGLVGGPALSA